MKHFPRSRLVFGILGVSATDNSEFYTAVEIDSVPETKFGRRNQFGLEANSTAEINICTTNLLISNMSNTTDSAPA